MEQSEIKPKYKHFKRIQFHGLNQLDGKTHTQPLNNAYIHKTLTRSTYYEIANRFEWSYVCASLEFY